MSLRLPLLGVRVHLSGSVPDTTLPAQAFGICSFVQKIASKIFSEGCFASAGSGESGLLS
jgi:hypothetical protein